YTDGLKTFTGLPEVGFTHIPRSQPSRTDLRKGAQSAVRLADRAIGNLQQWLVGTYLSAGLSFKSIWTSSSFGTIVGSNRWPPFRRCPASARGAHLRLTVAFAARGIC